MTGGAGSGERSRATVRDIERTILARVARGEYPAGSRLPTCDQLGRELGANKNTVSKAYQVLARKGYTASRPGRGTFVTGLAPRNGTSDGVVEEVRRLLGEAVAQARLVRMPSEELESLAVSVIRAESARTTVRVGYVDCNRADARQLGGELELAIKTHVDPLTVQDVAGRSSGPDDCYELLAVNLAHVRSVERRIERAEMNRTTAIVPVVALPDAPSLTKIAALAPGVRLLIITDTEEFLHTLTGLTRGINPAIQVSALLSSSAHLEDALSASEAVLVTRTAHRRVAALIHDKPTIIASFKLDDHSVAKVAECLAALRRGTSPSTSPTPR